MSGGHHKSSTQQFEIASASPQDQAAMVATSKALPRMGLGMAALGRPGYITLERNAIFGDGERTVDKMQTQANTVMDALFAASNDSSSTTTTLPWLDCARSYGLSEQFVGEYLRHNKINPNSVYVSSKWGYTYVADFKVSLPPGAAHEVKDHSTDNFLKQVQETNNFLGEYIDLYQIHSATFESGILTDERAHRALADCRKERGWKLGLSVSSPKQSAVIREALRIKVDNERLFDSVQCTYNLLEQRPGPALQEAHDAGVDVIIKEGLANGRILKNEVVQSYAQKLSCQPDHLALACILAQPFQPRVLSGAVTAEQLQSNLKAVGIVDKIQENESALLKEIMKSCVVDSEEYWAERAALAWN